MRQFSAFLKKEMTEIIRTYKFFIMACVFGILGFMNPLTAKFTPDLMKSFMPDSINIQIATPTALDSWIQFYKNVPQLGLIILAIVFSGIMANEYSKETFINLLTKGLSRSTIIVSKFIAVLSVWTISYLITFIISYGYTVYFWDETTPNLIFSVFCLWLFGIMIISFTLFGGVLLKSNYQTMLFVAAMVGILMLLKIPDKIKAYNPMMLATSNTELLTKAKEPSDFLIPIILTVSISTAFLVLAIVLFKKKKI